MPVFGELELKQDKFKNPMKILEQCIYLTEEESNISPKSIPIIENTFIKSFLVNYSDIKAYSEQQSITLEESYKTILFENNIFSDCKVVVSEETALYDSTILKELSNVVIKPISDNDPIYQIVESVIEELFETRNESLLEELTDAQSMSIASLYNKHKHRINKKFDEKLNSSKFAPQIQKLRDQYDKAFDKNPDDKKVEKMGSQLIKMQKNALKKLGKNKATKRLEAAKDRLVNYVNKKNAETQTDTAHDESKYTEFAKKMKESLHEYKDKSRAIISKKIASLRKIYDKWMNKAKSAGNTEISNKIKNTCELIIKAIGTLMDYQNQPA